MSSVGFVAPVKDVAALRAFAKEINGPRKADFAAANKRRGVVKERVFLVETPMGPMNMVYAEAPNAALTMALLSASSNAFDKFYLESVSKIAGVDFAKLPPGPPSHFVFEWTNGKPGKKSTMIAAPVPEPAKFWQALREMTQRTAEHTESRERHGITLERVFFLHDAKMAVVYIEGDDPQAAIAASMQSTAAYDKWFAERLASVHGIDFRATPPPQPELLVSYDG